MAKKSSSADKQNVDNLGSTPYIDKLTAREAFTESERWMKPYFDPIDEFERISRNKPKTDIPPELPRVTDGTMAAIAQENPKRIIQQLATGVVECDEYPEYAMIASQVHTKKLLPMYSRMGNALQKQWNMMSKAFVWGRSTSYTFFTSSNGVFHTDFILPYIKDIITEKGKVYAPDSNISFMRAWYQKRDLQGIIEREKRLMERDKNYTSEWDLKALAGLIDTGASAKPANQQTPSEREKGIDAGGFEIIHAFQAGKNAEFYSFAPLYADGKVLRTKINSDPRGKMPLDHEYCNIDLSNPLGRGQIELSGGAQNLVDQQMQMYQFLTTLLMGPPLQVWGDINKNKLKFRPNALWDMGKNPNNKVEPYVVSNHAIQQFSANYGLLKSQIMNLNNSQDHSVSGADTPNQSKTQAGVQAQESRLGVSDNYLRKQHESWFSDQAETSINIYFSEMKGQDTIVLESEDAKAVAKSDAAQYLAADGKTLSIPFDKIDKVAFKFQVDASSSEVKEDADNAQKLTEVLKIVQMSQDPTVRAAEPKITKLLLDEIGAEGTDDLFPDEQLDQNGQPIQSAANNPQMMMQQLMPQVQQMVAQMVQEATKAAQKAPKSLGESVAWKPGDLTDNERAQALAQVGIQADQNPTTPAQQDQATTQAIDIAKTAHQHALDMHNAAMSASQPHQPGDQGGGQQPQQQSPQPQQGQPLASDALNPQEQHIAEMLLGRGFSETDVEQAIVMLRQGRPLNQVLTVIGAKYGQRQ